MKPFLLSTPFIAPIVGTVPGAGMHCAAGQLLGIAQRHQGEDPTGFALSPAQPLWG